MKILITGATGMTGSLVLEYCLQDAQIHEVVSLVRRASGKQHEKLKEVLVDDFLNPVLEPALLEQLDAVCYCQGIYTGAAPADAFRQITVDYPLALAKLVKQYSPQARFCLLSGQGADRTEKSRMMFAKDKGAIENLLAAMGFKSFHAFRPAYIYPVTPRKEPNFVYTISRIIYPLIRLFGKKLSIRSTELAKAIYLTAIHGNAKEILENEDILNIK